MRVVPAWGEMASQTGPNGRTATITYDALGRRTAVWLPGQDRNADDVPNLKFTYMVSDSEPTAVTTEKMIWNETYLKEIAIYDGLLRPRQVQADTYSGRLITQTVYDSRNQVSFTSGANFNNDSGPSTELVRINRTNDVSRTEFVYDGAGRVTDEIFLVKDDEHGRTSTEYGGNDSYWQTAVTPPDGASATTTLEDARGNVVELRRHYGNDPAAAFEANTYEYSASGRIEAVEDPAGNRWSFTYDLRGRLVESDDPDIGVTAMAYDDAGQLVSTTDANGVVLSYEYDQLGRTIAQWEGSVDTGTLLSERTYDNGINGVGLPHTTTNWIDGEAWTQEIRKYNTAGQPVQLLTYLPESAGAFAGLHYQAFTHHPDGSVKTSTANPAGDLSDEVMTYGYDEMGQPGRVSGTSSDFGAGTIYVDEAVYSPYGQLLQRRLGDPDETGGTSGQVWQTWYYEEGTGRLAEFYLHKHSAGEFDGGTYGVAQLTYAYDQTGNILSITDEPVHTADALQPETQCFDYDGLNRLSEAWAQAGTEECADTPTASVVGGPGPYWSTYEYDEVGNRTSERRWTPAGQVEDTYTYQDEGHALAEVATTENGGERNVYTYDQAGSTTSIDRAGDLSILDWTRTGRLDTVTKGEEETRFFDDADGNRLARLDPDGTVTAWVAGYELIYNSTQNTIEVHRYYHHGDETIGMRIGRGAILWMTGDHHGTAQWIVNGDNLTTTVRRFDPFGRERGLTQGDWPDQRGFLGGIDNEALGLTTLGAREYDADTGRFISVDPVADYSDAQQLNGYSYANNNPVSFSDSTGRCWVGNGHYYKGPCDDDSDPGPTPEGGGSVGSLTVTQTVSSQGTIYGEYYNSGDECGYLLQGVVAAPCDMWNGTLQEFVDQIEELLYNEGERTHSVTGTFMPQDVAAGVEDICVFSSNFDLASDDCYFDHYQTLDEQRLAIEGAWAADAMEQNPGIAALMVLVESGPIETSGMNSSFMWKRGYFGSGLGLKTYFLKNCKKSFPAGTMVVMADGTTKPIEDVKSGDEVLSFEVGSGERASGTVDDTVFTPDQPRNLVTIGIDVDDDNETDIQFTATAGHAFLAASDPDSQRPFESNTYWVEAEDLLPGMTLYSDSGLWAEIVAVDFETRNVSTYNLSIALLHTYFIAVDDSYVLSHNCPSGDNNSWHSKLRGGRGDRDIDPIETMNNAERKLYDENGNQVYIWSQGQGTSHVVIRNPANNKIVTVQESTDSWIGNQVSSGRWYDPFE
ncbi:hypothetical protein GCM10029992_65660 [Glycomyces albus]